MKALTPKSICDLIKCSPTIPSALEVTHKALLKTKKRNERKQEWGRKEEGSLSRKGHLHQSTVTNKELISRQETPVTQSII